MTRKTTVNLRKRTRGGRFGLINRNKTPADNLKDFDRYWLGRTDPKGNLYIVYNPNTYYPGMTTRWRLNPIENYWTGRPKPETRDFQSLHTNTFSGSMFSDFPELGVKVELNTWEGTYIGIVNKRSIVNGRGSIDLLVGYSPRTGEFENQFEKQVTIELEPHDRWRAINAPFHKETPHPVTQEIIDAHRVLNTELRKANESEDDYKARLKKAYLVISRKNHPDKNKDKQSTENFQKIVNAKELLGLGGRRT